MCIFKKLVKIIPVSGNCMFGVPFLELEGIDKGLYGRLFYNGHKPR
jgi:hypothetical protein